MIGNGRVGGSVAVAARSAGLETSVSGSGLGHSAAHPTELDDAIVLLCVPDRAITDATARVIGSGARPAYLGHVSGAHGLDVLAAARARGIETFSLHPLQTIPHAGTDLAAVPCAVAGSTPEAGTVATTLARRLGMRPFDVPEDRRAAYHAAAVFASNFLVALEETAVQLLAAAGVADARDVLAPLVLRTAANWSDAGGSALTGPIARGDEDTVARHLEALRDLAPELLPLYDVLAERTRAVARAARTESEETRP